MENKKRINQANAPLLIELPDYTKTPETIYQSDVLFHGPDFQGIRELLGCGEAGIAARIDDAPAPKYWITRPLRKAWLADPLALDCAFQLMSIWSREIAGHADFLLGQHVA